MGRKAFKFMLLLFCILSFSFVPVYAWSNGGYTDPGNAPNISTHDWIALHAMQWLSPWERWWLEQHVDNYLLGTELPDNSAHPWGIGDTTLHHVYYSSAGVLTDASSAIRANTEYGLALTFLNAGNYSFAALHAGIMSHYIVDVGVWGHVMGSGTDWGAEVHHSDYESAVETRTNEYPTDDFSVYLSFDGTLSHLDAYNATLQIAYNTTFGGVSGLGCVWMDTHYNWSNATFRNRSGESVNLCINKLADVLHTLYKATTSQVKLNCFDALFRYNNARMVFPDSTGPKALGCGTAMVSDWLASMSVSTQLINLTEGLDTSSVFVNQTSGVAKGASGTGIVTFGGQFVNPIVKYAESESTPSSDRAPITFYNGGDTFYFRLKNGSDIPGANLPLAVINHDKDMFVIEAYKDGAGRYIMLCYGFGWKGTYAAGKYFDKLLYPSIASHKTSWIILKWEDTNGDGFVNNLGDGDTYTLVASDSGGQMG